MPRRESSNITHVAVSDHRIPRIAGQFEPPDPRPPKRGVDGHGIRNLQSQHIKAGDPDAGRDLGVALVNKGAQGGPESHDTLEAALLLLRKAVEREPQDAVAWDAIGRALVTQKQFSEGLKAYERALKINPRREVTIANAAIASKLVSRLNDSLDYWRKAVEINPQQNQYRLGLATAYLNIGQAEAAVVEYERVLEMNPADLYAHLYMGRAHSKLGNHSAAIKRYEIILKHDPRFYPARINLGDTYAVQGQFRPALREYLLILQIEPTNIEVRNRVVRCYDALGDPGQAQQHRNLLPESMRR